MRFAKRSGLPKDDYPGLVIFFLIIELKALDPS